MNLKYLKTILHIQFTARASLGTSLLARVFRLAKLQLTGVQPKLLGNQHGRIRNGETVGQLELFTGARVEKEGAVFAQLPKIST